MIRSMMGENLEFASKYYKQNGIEYKIAKINGDKQILRGIDNCFNLNVTFDKIVPKESEQEYIKNNPEKVWIAGFTLG